MTARSELLDKAERLRDDISRGGCEDYAEYREKVGELRGYLKAIKVMDEYQGDLDDAGDGDND